MSVRNSEKMNTPKALFLAARPRTLPAALAPVLLGSACAAAAGSFRIFPAILAGLFALFAQIASNFANDYGDFKKGADTPERVGFARATASGWLSPQQMILAIVSALFIAGACGLGLVTYGGPWMLAVGAASMLACLAYTVGPFPLAYHGLGDVFVVVFFGLVAVAFTAWTQAGTFPPFVWIIALACGLGADNILLVNNLRDRETDAKAGKRTTVVIFGSGFARGFYKFNMLFMFLTPLILRYGFGFQALTILLPMVVLPFLMPNLLRPLSSIKDPREYNLLLGETAKFLLVFAVLQSVGLFISAAQTNN